jgi:hypothetical protein
MLGHRYHLGVNVAAHEPPAELPAGDSRRASPTLAINDKIARSAEPADEFRDNLDRLLEFVK